MVKLPPRSQGRMPPQGSPFAAFSGTPSAPFAEYGTKAAQTMTGNHNIQRTIIIFVFVAISSSPISQERNATGIGCHVFFPRRGSRFHDEDSMQASAFEFASGVANSPHHCVAIAITLTRPRTGAAQCALRQTQAIWLPEWGPTGECSNCSPGIACNQAN
jgi:hypothetical protein